MTNSAPRLIAAATDFSPQGDRAVARAIHLARLHGARLLVVHVLPAAVNPNPLIAHEKMAQAEAELNHGLADASRDELNRRYLADCQGIEAEAVLLEGRPVAALCCLAGERGVELIVAGATGQSGLKARLMGSVTARLVRKAPCSVLVVRPPEGGA